MAELFGLEARAVAQLREIARQVLKEERTITPSIYRRNSVSQIDVYVLKTSTGGITAATTADVTGSGTATVYYNSTGNTLTQWSTETVTVRNMTQQAVGGSRFIQAKYDVFGTLWVDVEACT